MPVTFLMAHSVIYELIEWGAAEMFGGDLGVAYLGTQGDVWDAQKDMGLATADPGGLAADARFQPIDAYVRRTSTITVLNRQRLHLDPSA